MHKQNCYYKLKEQIDIKFKYNIKNITKNLFKLII